jgi:16S rRNA (uracil1498-N3)-methyltransferase
MRRFFIEPENISGATAVLTGTEARHISTVLRLAAETAITLFDGTGSYYEALITKISPARVETRIISIIPYIDTAEEKYPALHLAVGLLKGKKMDFIIQKSTELGIESVRPFRSLYCAARDATAVKHSRWLKIALEACKQCNRPKPPDIYEATGFETLLSLSENENYSRKIIFWEDEKQHSLQETLATASELESVLIFIGPEGGFSSDEVTAAIAAGFQPATLGSRILRAETAVIAAVAILQHELGNLS